MLSDYLKTALAQIRVLERFLIVYEDTACFDTKFPTIPHAGDPLVRSQERIFRHCSTITRLYSIYENMIMSCSSHWLSIIPNLKEYEGISNNLKDAYRDGVPKILSQSNSRKYKHLNITQELKKYINAIEGGDPWEFIPEALTHQSSNLRFTNLEKLLNLISNNEFRSYMAHNQAFNHAIQSVGTRKSVETWIDDTVAYRNDAAHGTPDDILGSAELADHIEIFTALCTVIVNFLKYNASTDICEEFPMAKLGKITEKFRNNILIGTFDRGTIDVGQTLCFYKYNYYAEAKIESIELCDESKEELRISVGSTEVGLRMSSDIACDTHIVIGIDEI